MYMCVQVTASASSPSTGPKLLHVLTTKWVLSQKPLSTLCVGAEDVNSLHRLKYAHTPIGHDYSEEGTNLVLDLRQII